LLILRKVLKSVMTCCVSFFVATLTRWMSYMWFIRFYRPSSFSGPRSHLTSLGLSFVGQVDSFLFLDLQFLHPVYMWVERCRYWKLLLVFIERVRKGQSKGTRQELKVQEEHRTLSTFKKNVIDFLGLNEHCKFGLGSFDLKLYRLAKISGKTENYSLSTQQ